MRTQTQPCKLRAWWQRFAHEQEDSLAVRGILASTSRRFGRGRLIELRFPAKEKRANATHAIRDHADDEEILERLQCLHAGSFEAHHDHRAQLLANSDATIQNGHLQSEATSLARHLLLLLVPHRDDAIRNRASGCHWNLGKHEADE